MAKLRAAVGQAPGQAAQPGGKQRHRRDGGQGVGGEVEGNAGGTHLWVVLPTLAIASFAGVALYLAAYALATVTAMTLFSAGLGRMAKRLANGSPQLGYGFGLACCTASLLVGGYWLFAG